MLWANVIVWVLVGYAALGVVIGVGFVGWGVSRLDHSAKGAPLGFRLIILPGVAALWPWVLARVLARRAEGTREAHP